MKKVMLVGLFLACSLSCAGCGGGIIGLMTPGYEETMAKMQPLDPERARVFFYCPAQAVLSTRALAWTLNNSSVYGAILTRTFTFDDLRPGTYDLALPRAGLFPPKHLLDVTVEPAKTYYIRFDAHLDAALVDQKTALRELKDLKGSTDGRPYHVSVNDPRSSGIAGKWSEPVPKTSTTLYDKSSSVKTESSQ